MFTKDHRTGLVEELVPGERKARALVQDKANEARLRVLVANDDDVNRRQTIRRLCQAWPIERDMMVESAADEADAVEKVRRSRYALVVLDWNLSHQNGGEGLRAIRKDDLRVPIVVVSDQRRKTVARNLESMSATFVYKHQLDPNTFRKAITRSILLQEGAFGLVRSGFDLTLNGRLKISIRPAQPEF